MANAINIGLVVNASTRQARNALKELSGDTANLSSALGLATKAAAAAGGAVIAVGGVALKFASDYESSLAGVAKTVDGTTQEIAGLGSQIRSLSKDIPVNVNELLGIAEAAGQLGIQKTNIVGFTKVMAELGVATNLTSDQAATALARLANVMGTPQDQFDRLGSTIVGLGNNFATTESEILDFGLRMAGAGKIAGLTEAEVLGIGAAMSSVGVSAEAGGTAVQKVLLGITQAVANGGEDLQTFANTAGMTAQQFKTAWREDAGGAFTAFVEGLGRQGDEAFVTLAKLDLQDQRLIRSFLSLSGAGDLLERTMREGNTAFRENVALSEESRKRFETLQSQWGLLKNAVGDVAISIGLQLLPVFKDFVRIAREYVNTDGQNIARIFGIVFVEAIGFAVDALADFHEAVTKVREATNNLGAFFTSLHLQQLQRERDELVRMAEAWDDTKESLEEYSSTLVGTAHEALADQGTTLQDVLDRIKEYDAKIAQAGGTLQGFREQSEDVRLEHGRLEEILERAKRKLGEWRAMIQGAAGDIQTLIVPAAANFALTLEAASDAAHDVGLNIGGIQLQQFERSLNTTHDKELVRFVSTTTGLTEVQASFMLKAGKSAQEVIHYGRMLNSTNPRIREFAREQLGLNSELEETHGLLSGLKGGFDSLLQGLTGGNGFGGFMEGLGAGITEGFGQMISGGISSVISKGIGLLQSGIASLFDSLFTSREEARTDRAVKIFGPLGSVSEALAKSIAEVSMAASDANRELPDTIASIVKLGDVLQETGIKDQQAFQFAAEKAREGIERFNDCLITEEELVQSLSGAFPVLVENLDKADATGTRVFRDLIENTRAAGIEIKEITEFVDRMTSEGADALNRFAGSFETMVEVVVDEEGRIVGRLSDLADQVEEDVETRMVSSFEALAGDEGAVALLRQQFNLTAGEMIANGSSILEVLDALGPTIDAANEAGIKLGGQFGFLQGLSKKLADEGIQKIVDRQSALNDMIQTTNSLGLMSDETFQTFAQNAVAGYEDLVNAGIKEQDALRLQAPILAQLRDAAAKYGFSIDEGTQALLDQAEAQGALPPLIEPMERVLGDIRDILTSIAEVFGADLPDGIRKFRDQAVDDIGDVGKALKSLGGVSFNGSVSSTGIPSIGPRASGGLTPASGGPFHALLHNNELIIPSEVTNLLLNAARAGGGTTSTSAGSNLAQYFKDLQGEIRSLSSALRRQQDMREYTGRDRSLMGTG